LAQWPLSGTGRYRLRLESDEIEEEREVEITPEKITAEAYAVMVDDLQTTLPASVAIGLQRAGALQGLELKPPRESTLATELSRLRQAIRGGGQRSGLAASLPAVARDPHLVLKKTEQWVAGAQVRRLEPAGLIAALQKPNNIEAGTRLPIRVPDVRVEQHVDVYENRLLRSFHDQVARRLRRLRAALEARKQYGPLDEVDELINDLRRARRNASFLDDVAPLAQAPTRVTMVLLKRPEYRAVLEGYLRFRRSAYVQLQEPALEAPLQNLPYLYELWGTLVTIQALVEAAACHGYRVHNQRLARHIDHGVYVNVLPDGQPAVDLRHPTTSVRVRLIPQRTYATDSRRLHSISFSQIPDVTIEVRSPGEQPQLYLFDPKYKLQSENTEYLDGRPKKIDIDTMHAYRDAIRDVAGERVVRYAAILYPGSHRNYGDRIEALPARPDDPNALVRRLRDVLTVALEPSRHPRERRG
jgi:predicted component of viral defense system (DUF524 family)